MKKLILSFIAVTFLLGVFPSNIEASEEVGKEIESKTRSEVKTELNKMVDRVTEINEMDLKALSKEERKEIKTELREIKRDFKAYSDSENPAVSEAAAEAAKGSGLYISTGAIIIILLLIIIL